MERRNFISAALAAGGAWLSARAAAAGFQGGTAPKGPERASEFYELRRYHLRRGPATAVVDNYLKTAAVPAWQRAGAGPVGVFSVMIGAGNPTFYVLLVHKSLDAFGSLPE